MNAQRLLLVLIGLIIAVVVSHYIEKSIFPEDFKRE